MPRLIQNYFTGRVTRTTLLALLLPLSFVAAFGALIVTARLFPAAYDWRVNVISDLTSPRDNPKYYWIACVGIAISALFALPFAGYLARRVSPFAPTVARLAGVAFGVGFVLLILNSVVVPQDLAAAHVLNRAHEIFARASAGIVALGMVICCVCALRDRCRFLGGRRCLCATLTVCWASITLVPLGCLVVSGILRLGRIMGLDWAGTASEYLKHTAMWHLAFWEWLASGSFFLFMVVSVVLLPEKISPESLNGKNCRAVEPPANAA